MKYIFSILHSSKHKKSFSRIWLMWDTLKKTHT